MDLKKFCYELYDLTLRICNDSNDILNTPDETFVTILMFARSTFLEFTVKFLPLFHYGFCDDMDETTVIVCFIVPELLTGQV